MRGYEYFLFGEVEFFKSLLSVSELELGKVSIESGLFDSSSESISESMTTSSFSESVNSSGSESG